LAYGLICTIFIYTTVVNSFERPDGIKIASFFIGAILLVSLVSRGMRSTELRVGHTVLDDLAQKMLDEANLEGPIRLVAHRPGHLDYPEKAKEACETHNIQEQEIIFLEVSVGDASEFDDELLEVRGEKSGNYRILKCQSPAVPNALAAILLDTRDRTDQMPHLYLGWTEGNPVAYILKYLFLGEGETAPVTREILREAVKDPKQRPRVHVG
jgi:hypothetical protein